MNRFYHSFLQERINGRVQVAAFGKHPGWDDHIEDLDVSTDSLAIAKQLLYSGGIAKQLASGDWDRLETAGTALTFDHRFVWSRGQHSLLGAIWASKDGKGRSRFPMIACIQAEVGSLLAIRLYLDPIEQIAERCRAADSKKEVSNILAQFIAKLNSREFAAGFTPDQPPSQKSAHDTNSVQDSLLVIAGAVTRTGATSDPPQSVHRRLTIISPSLRENLRFWSGYLERKSHLPALTVANPAAQAVDVIVGEPQPADFFCLRAAVPTLPTAQPSLELKRNRSLRMEAQDFLRAWRSGKSAVWKPPTRWWQSILKR